MSKHILKDTVYFEEGSNGCMAMFPRDGVYGSALCYKFGKSYEEVRKKALNAIYQRRWRMKIKYKCYEKCK